MKIHVYHHLDPDFEHRLFKMLAKQGEKIMATLDTLTADVTADTSAVNSAVTLINNLVAEIKAAGTDPIALKALTDQLETNTKTLADAVAANTPADPAA